MESKRVLVDEDYLGPANKNWSVFLISVLGLFLEMLFIRWIGTEIRIFSYVQNTVLIVCFIGLGLGCFTCRQPIKMRQALIPLTFMVLLLAIPLVRTQLGKLSGLLSIPRDLVIWEQIVNPNLLLSILYMVLGLAATYCLLIFVLNIFVPIGRILGRTMDDHPNTLWAYSLNIAGSLVGTWLFVALSYLNLPPVMWFIVVVVLIIFFLRRVGRDFIMNLALLAGIVLFAWIAGMEPGAIAVKWSPYQKLVVKVPNRSLGNIGKYIISVNNAGYQMIDDLRSSNTSTDPSYYPADMAGLSQYDIPLLLHANPKSYLVVGAGAGNDAAGGVRAGVEHITAVEIDPAIVAFGRQYHPEKPYQSPAVNVVIDDARSFFATTKEKYDVISFGLLDSHTTAGMTNARLDNYVYTKESILRASELLAPGGILTLSFEVQRPYIADRIAAQLQDIFGEAPMVFRIPATGYGWGGVMFVAGDLGVARAQIAANPRLSNLIASFIASDPITLTHTAEVTTDDWPYLYLESRQIPLLYFLLAGVMLLVFLRGYKAWKADGLFGRWDRSYWHFFFLGAAFLLLEVQNISKASVVLGSTWQVNAVIVSGVMLMALLANLVAAKLTKLPTWLAYVGLIGACLGLYFVDLAQFAFLPYATKAVVVGSLTALPMLFSGIVFVRSFAQATRKNEALGANMIGSLVGALLQSMTFITGIKALLLVVAAFYCISIVTLPKKAEITAAVKVPVIE
ncbi:MAG: spermine/spermidine synthase domain-containing protein [Anaerolineae bacterium]